MGISGFGTVLLFISGGLIFILITLFVSRLLRPSRPNEEKLSTYESGEETVRHAWGKFNIRFYIVALVFLLFEVELVFLFPWAIVFGDADLINATNGVWGWFAFTEVAIFVGLLVIGLVYVWKKGMLDWVKPAVDTKDLESKVPQSAYDAINKKFS